MLTTDRLLLRPWCLDDLDPLTRMSSDPEVMRFFPRTRTREQCLALIKRQSDHQEKHGFCFWVAELQKTKTFIGFIGMAYVAEEIPCDGSVEIGWSLDKDHWGKGYAAEGARAALVFAFSKLQLEEVVSMTSTINLPSQRVMQKIGMKYDSRDDFLHSGVDDHSPLKPHVLYRIKATDPIAF